MDGRAERWYWHRWTTWQMDTMTQSIWLKWKCVRFRVNFYFQCFRYLCMVVKSFQPPKTPNPWYIFGFFLWHHKSLSEEEPWDIRWYNLITILQYLRNSKSNWIVTIGNDVHYQEYCVVVWQLVCDKSIIKSSEWADSPLLRGEHIVFTSKQ